MQIVGERLGITDQFQGVGALTIEPDGSLRIMERVEGGKHQISVCAAPPAVLGWATGNLPEPRNNPQVGMANMRGIMPALQKAKPSPVGTGDITFTSVSLPTQSRTTQVIKDVSPGQIAADIVAWIKGE
jgi:electron transfer flavoprotein beta subunit